MFRQHYLRELKKQYPNLNKFPIRPNPNYLPHTTAYQGATPMPRNYDRTSFMDIMNSMHRKQFSTHKCPKCKAPLKFNMLGVLAKECGVFHKGGEFWCTTCGGKYRFMLNKDNITADNLRKQGLGVRGFNP